MNVAVVPVKELCMSKRRLSSILTPEERACLSLAMFQDVLSVLCQVRSLDEITVVTRDPNVAYEAEKLGAGMLPEAGCGLNPALSQAARARKSADWTLIYIPSDVPCLAANDVERLIRASAESDLVLVPDAQNLGTNALALRPADLLPFRFEGQSLAAHLEEGRRHHRRTHLFPLESLSWDIDRPSDLVQLWHRGTHTRAFQVLNSISVGATR